MQVKEGKKTGCIFIKSGAQAKCIIYDGIVVYVYNYLYWYIHTHTYTCMWERERDRQSETDIRVKENREGEGIPDTLWYIFPPSLFFFIWPNSPPVVQGLLIHEVSRSHSTPHHSRQDSSGRVISSSQRPLPDNAQHYHQTDIHAPGGIRIHNLSRPAAADLRLRPRGYWDRLFIYHNQ